MNTRSSLPRALCAPLLGALLGASALLWGRQAAAEESDAERLFREGRALVVEGRFAEACPKLEESQRLEPRLGTKLNVAFCHERLGKIATAWVGFQEAVITARTEGDVAREAFARGRADALEPRVPWLRVRGAAGADADQLTILIDGAPLAPSAWDKELPVDPGEHALVAAHGGEEYWRTTVALRESEHVEVSIPAAAPAAPAGAPVTASKPAPRSPTRHARRDGAPEETSARPGGTRAAGRFVYEVGAFAGYISMHTTQSETDEHPSSIQAVGVDYDGTTQLLTCATAVCEYSDLDSSGFVAGAAGFVGYAASAHVDLGLRFLIGPRLGGGALVALGPSASFRIGERVRVGPTVLFGTASHAESGVVTVEGPTSTSYVDSWLRATLGLSVGLGAELGLKLMSSPTGSVVLQATPLFLYGSDGTAFSLPLGAAYRWN